MTESPQEIRPEKTRVSEYLGSSERVLLETRQHPFAIIGAFFMAFVLMIPIALVMWGVSGLSMFDNAVGDFINGAGMLALIGVVLWLIWKVAGWEFERLAVTSEKIIYVRGLISKNASSTPLVKVSEMTIHTPLIGKVFGYGWLSVDSPGGGQKPIHGLRFLPDPSSIYRLINDLARTRRTSEGGGRHDQSAGGAGGYTSDAKPAADDDGGTTDIIR